MKHEIKQVETDAGESFHLKCPHNIPVEIIDVLGVISYRHKFVPGGKRESGKPCMLMNRLDCSSGAISRAIIAEKLEMTNETIAAIVVSSDARKSAYKILSEAKGKELAQLLKLYLDIVELSVVVEKPILIREYILTFGSVGVENARHVAGKDFKSFVGQQHLGTPKYPMEKLTAAIVEQIDGTDENKRAKSRERLSSILFGEDDE
jgi:hypothetical protein